MKYLCGRCGGEKARYWDKNSICRSCWKKSCGGKNHYNFGKKLSLETRLKISKGNTGKRMGAENHKYKANKEIRRTYRLEWRLWKLEVLKRDFNTCRICFSRDNVCVHHIRPYNDEKMNMGLENGITLCNECHKITFGREHLFEQLFQNTLRNAFNSVETSKEIIPSQQEKLRKVLRACVTVRGE